METQQQEEWKFVSMVCGALYVMITGIWMMLELSADNLDCLIKVNLCTAGKKVLIRSILCTAVPKALRTSQYGEGYGPVLLNQLRCSGDEISLIQCSHSGGHYCDHSKDASVVCSNG